MATPLWKKLGYQPGMKVQLIDAPEAYPQWVAPLPEGIVFSETEDLGMIHIFTNEINGLRNNLLDARQRIRRNGMIWISWYKKAARLPTELNEDLIRQTAIAHRLVDVKVCRINDQWSGLKLVIPLKYR